MNHFCSGHIDSEIEDFLVEPLWAIYYERFFGVPPPQEVDRENRDVVMVLYWLSELGVFTDYLRILEDIQSVRKKKNLIYPVVRTPKTEEQEI